MDYESGCFKKFKNLMIGNTRLHYTVLAVLALLILVCSGWPLTHSSEVKNGENRETCTSESCIISAALFADSMNKSVDPCDDFYQFACGKYTNTRRQSTSVAKNRFFELQNLMLPFIRDFMELDDINTKPNSSLAQSRKFYRSCMAIDQIDAVGMKSLVNLLDDIGLPTLGLIKGNPFLKVHYVDITAILAGIKKRFDIDYLFSFNVEIDAKYREYNHITLRPPRFLSSYLSIETRLEKTKNTDDMLNKTENINDIVGENHITKKYIESVYSEIISYLNSTNSTKIPNINYDDINEKIRSFHYKIHRIRTTEYRADEQLPILWSLHDFQDFTNEIFNFNESNGLKKTINWEQYLTSLLEIVGLYELNTDEVYFRIQNIEYFEALFRVLANTDTDEIVNNVWWEVVESVIPLTTHQLRFARSRFIYEKFRAENALSRSLYCADSVNKMYGMAFAHLMDDLKTMDSNENKVTSEIMDNMHWAFDKIVEDLDWMDEKSKKRTQLKNKEIKTFLGFGDIKQDDLDAVFSYYKIDENDFFGNIVRYKEQKLLLNLLDIARVNTFNHSRYSSDPLEVNAYNSIQSNAIVIPPGILRFPFFGHDLQVLNYGFLGFILAHELFHSFDNHGRMFDENGNANKWWTNESLAEYEKRTKCFVNHYESYSLPGMTKKVNGKLTLNENIADNGAIKGALLAYRKYVNENGQDPKIPGLEEYSNEQIYFIAFANNWCEVTSREILSNSLEYDSHSPKDLRVIATLTNSEEFSEIWKCPKGTRMNPNGEKCKLWW